MIATTAHVSTLALLLAMTWAIVLSGIYKNTSDEEPESGNMDGWKVESCQSFLGGFNDNEFVSGYLEGPFHDDVDTLTAYPPFCGDGGSVVMKKLVDDDVSSVYEIEEGLSTGDCSSATGLVGLFFNEPQEPCGVSDDRPFSRCEHTYDGVICLSGVTLEQA